MMKCIPNDLFLDDKTQQIIIITGPNMSGKSALLRQTALIVLLAQIGSHVPCDKADIGLVDKIFSQELLLLIIFLKESQLLWLK